MIIMIILFFPLLWAVRYSFKSDRMRMIFMVMSLTDWYLSSSPSSSLWFRGRRRDGAHRLWSSQLDRRGIRPVCGLLQVSERLGPLCVHLLHHLLMGTSLLQGTQTFAACNPHTYLASVALREVCMRPCVPRGNSLALRVVTFGDIHFFHPIERRTR